MYRLHKLPFDIPILSLELYKQLSEANINIGELKGILDLTPNLSIILKLVNIGEAKTSLEIDKIFTSYEKIFLKSITNIKSDQDTISVINYLKATEVVCDEFSRTHTISLESLHKVQLIFKPEDIGIRKLPGVKIYSKSSSEVVHVPPRNQNIINEYLENLEDYVNNDLDNYDPLIKTALIHYQFECIHPYKEGNGGVGRMLNIMYLAYSRRISYPIINLSRYINTTTNQYYELLEKCHNDITYIDEFVLYFLKGIKETSRYTINLIHQINRLISSTDKDLKETIPSIYSKDLVLHLFDYMYTKNETLRTSLNISRTTATKYLKELEKHNFVYSKKVGKEVIYTNVHLYNIFT